MSYIEFISNFLGSSQYDFLYPIFGCIASLLVLDGVFRFIMTFFSGLFTVGSRGKF